MTNLSDSPDKATSKPRNEQSSDSNKLEDPSPAPSTQQSQEKPLGNPPPSSSTQRPQKEIKSAEWFTKRYRKDKWNHPTSDPSKWDAKSDHRTTGWRECFNNYCRVHLRAKQDHGYFPKLREYNPSQTHPGADASPGSSTQQPKATQPSFVHHDSPSWTMCYDHRCPTHLAAKKDWGWFPRKARSARYDLDNGQPDSNRPSASPASSTRHPHTSAVDHASLSWTVCYDASCPAHLAAKKDWGWFPSHGRYVFGKPWPQNSTARQLWHKDQVEKRSDPR